MPKSVDAGMLGYCLLFEAMIDDGEDGKEGQKEQKQMV